MSNQLKLSQKIAWLLKVRGLTQLEVARRLSIYPSNLNQYLRGRSDIHAELFSRLLLEVGIDLDAQVQTQMESGSVQELVSQRSLGRVFEMLTEDLSQFDQELLIRYVAKFASVNLGKKGEIYGLALERVCD